MKYLVVQDWGNTHGNHAGMVHMCKLLCERYPDDYEMYVKPNPKSIPTAPRNFFGKVLIKLYTLYLRNFYQKITFPKEYLKLCQPMFEKLVPGDEVYLLEYLIPWASQYELASYIKQKFPGVRIYALSHLTVKHFKEIIDRKKNNSLKWFKQVDKMLTLGSSLSHYFVGQGVPVDKISTGFHYVDNDYYHRLTSMDYNDNRPLTIITMGALQRDYSMLSSVVKACPEVHWIICKGNKNIDNWFKNTPNVELKGFMAEDDLRVQMDSADVSLNLMEDTVGSNVITTSMAMGLAIIVTDVGSIRDYCSEENSIFCAYSTESVLSAINLLNNDRKRVLKMKMSSLDLSNKLRIEYIHDWFCSMKD